MAPSFDKKLGDWVCRNLIRGREIDVRIAAPENAAIGDLERRILAVTSTIPTCSPGTTCNSIAEATTTLVARISSASGS